jgi:hypothetical protein
LIARAFEMETFYRIVEIQQQGETSLTATIPNDIAEKMNSSRVSIEDYLELIKNLPENKKGDGWDYFDLFTQSFEEISKNLSDSLKEFNGSLPRIPKR